MAFAYSLPEQGRGGATGFTCENLPQALTDPDVVQGLGALRVLGADVGEGVRGDQGVESFFPQEVMVTAIRALAEVPQDNHVLFSWKWKEENQEWKSWREGHRALTTAHL